MKTQAKLIIGDSRSMSELDDATIELIVTSPPYWHIKDYSVKNQIGFGQSLHEYLTDLNLVWTECIRILKPGRRLCINIGDQFARTSVYGRYKIIPLHAEVISQCEQIGFDFMGSIIWQKRTTMRTSGGATIMGSYPHPPNGLVELDYEHILLFKRPGEATKVPKHIKESSKLTKDEWKDHFSGHWRFGGAHKLGHEAMFPDELPRRLIKMFTFVGETVLDPFLGSGTTMKAALEMDRNAIGYELNAGYLGIIKEKLGDASDQLSIIRQKKRPHPSRSPSYKPRIQDARPLKDHTADGPKELHKVATIIDERTIGLDTGLAVGLLGVRIEEPNRGKAIRYLCERVKGRRVILRFDDRFPRNTGPAEAYVYLSNKIFINAYLIKSGLASVDEDREFSMKKKFMRLRKD